ncbi:MAG TPA: hypothetical protein VIG82_06205 [Enteractinococcus sp.]
MDFRSIIDTIQPAAAGLAILTAAALWAQVEFACWAAPKVARFFATRYLRR